MKEKTGIRSILVMLALSISLVMVGGINTALAEKNKDRSHDWSHDYRSNDHRSKNYRSKDYRKHISRNHDDSDRHSYYKKHYKNNQRPRHYVSYNKHKVLKHNNKYWSPGHRKHNYRDSYSYRPHYSGSDY